jgi:hypothetical protein
MIDFDEDDYTATCDVCLIAEMTGETTEELERKMRKYGWLLHGQKHTCPDCKD